MNITYVIAVVLTIIFIPPLCALILVLFLKIWTNLMDIGGNIADNIADKISYLLKKLFKKE